MIQRHPMFLGQLIHWIMLAQLQVLHGTAMLLLSTGAARTERLHQLQALWLMGRELLMLLPLREHQVKFYSLTAQAHQVG